MSFDRAKSLEQNIALIKQARVKKQIKTKNIEHKEILKLLDLAIDRCLECESYEVLEHLVKIRDGRVK
ncbi:hypothetical protein [Campylobacter corcagiensis]|uniref:Uncharacterized protein n=1 Tax=Campylobacter corcagiensis TaxID=1448857 RepID=A0A7M1LG68_9BACT|nr:hypothetical protein [Campylobacter corcagiensis]QKF64522.1 hypothetical protein CCORG_0656 [Campylobacter corcagiensis]QOQ87301.1 hypothetical protein IMC76_00280 [Campylobacter corcagiensis]